MAREGRRGVEASQPRQLASAGRPGRPLFFFFVAGRAPPPPLSSGEMACVLPVSSYLAPLQTLHTLDQQWEVSRPPPLSLAPCCTGAGTTAIPRASWPSPSSERRSRPPALPSALPTGPTNHRLPRLALTRPSSEIIHIVLWSASFFLPLQSRFLPLLTPTLLAPLQSSPKRPRRPTPPPTWPPSPNRSRSSWPCPASFRARSARPRSPTAQRALTGVRPSLPSLPSGRALLARDRLDATTTARRRLTPSPPHAFRPPLRPRPPGFYSVFESFDALKKYAVSDEHMKCVALPPPSVSLPAPLAGERRPRSKRSADPLPPSRPPRAGSSSRTSGQ